MSSPLKQSVKHRVARRKAATAAGHQVKLLREAEGYLRAAAGAFGELAHTTPAEGLGEGRAQYYESERSRLASAAHGLANQRRPLCDAHDFEFVDLE